MKQGSLDGFLGLRKKREVPDTFCLTWEEDQPCVFLHRRENAQFVKASNLRYKNANFEISLYASPEFMSAQTFPSSTFKLEGVPFLKSLMQKAVRRGFLEQAIFASYNLLQLDYMILYRRLPIIMIEDVCMHTGFGALVWHMMANLPPSAKFTQWILGLVKLLCEVAHATDYDKIDHLPKIISEDPMVWCAIIRIEYGGLKGDVQMLKYIVHELNSNKMTILDTAINAYVDGIRVPNMWMYEAIDFHIMPSILCMECAFRSEEVKKMMWCNSSSLNFRRQTVPYRIEDWKTIVYSIRKLQHSYFARIRV